MMLAMALFWGLVIWAGVLLIRRLAQPGPGSRAAAVPATAQEILKERYARGEISRDEFEQMKKDIQ